MWWLWIVYGVGFLVSMRLAILHAVEYIEEERDAWSKRTDPYSRGLSNRPEFTSIEVIIVGATALFWPIIAAGVVFWKGMFPRGVRTKYAKEKERVAKLKKVEEDLRTSREEIQRLSKEAGLKIPEGFEQ